MATVTQAAVIGRVRRALRKRGEMLRRTRWGRIDRCGNYIPTRARLELGEFYILDAQRNCIVAQDIDLEQTARDLEVLNERETVAQPE